MGCIVVGDPVAEGVRSLAGAQLRIARCDPLQRRFNQLARRHLAAANGSGLLDCGGRHVVTTYSELNGSWISSRSTELKPADLHSSCTRAGGNPHVPSPAPPCASEVVMQYTMLIPYISVATGPTLSSGSSALFISRTRNVPSGASACRIAAVRACGSA